MVLLLFAACVDYDIQPVEAEPLVLTVTSPTYGQYLGAGPVQVEGTVTPSDAALFINGEPVPVAGDGRFTTSLPFTDRAMLVDAKAVRVGEKQRVVVPVFDSVDPRLYDPGAARGLLTAEGLDALEPIVGDLVDSLGWEDQILAALPTVETDWLSLYPAEVSSSGTTVDLAPGDDAVSATITLHDVEMVTTVDVLSGWWTFDVGLTLGNITVGAAATPDLVDDMLQLTLSDMVVDIGDVAMDFGGLELPDWLADLLLEPIADLVSTLGTYLGDYLLESLGVIELGGPFSFEFDLMGTTLSAKLAEIGTTPDGVGLGATIGIDADAADKVPGDLAELPTTTSTGAPYQLGFAVHEGMLNVVMDQALAGFLDLDLDLDGATGDMLAAGFLALPGGDQLPDHDGFCLSVHAGDARVVRFLPGTGAPLARAYLPDLRVAVQVKQEGSCNDWLDAVIFATIDLSLDGTAVEADLAAPQSVILYYGAEGVDEDAVAQGLGGVVTGLASLLGDSLSFDLGGAIDLGGIPLDPRIVAVEPLDETGLTALYLDTF